MDQKADPEMKGWLSKWTNYIKGYQRRWFVLSNGFLSYYRNQAEMAHTCRGNISLHGAMIHTEDSCTFVISNGGTQTFHLRAANEVERQRWVTALELAKSNAIRAMESDEEDEIVLDDQSQSQEAELQNILKNLSARLEDLQTCNDLIVKHGSALQRSLSELETIDTATDVPSKIKAVNERATLFRITSATVINACQDYLLLAQSQGRKWQKMLQHERDQRQRLEEVVEQLARQHSHLEQAAKDHQTPRTSMPQVSPSDEDEDNEFYDAQSDQSHSENQQNFIIKIPMGHRRTSSAASLGSQGADNGPRDSQDEASGSSSDVENSETKVLVISSGTNAEAGTSQSKKEVGESSSKKDSSKAGTSSSSPSGTVSPPAVIRKRRTRVPDKPNYPLNLWSIMKNCIGKDLSKIPLPVNFCEPLSMLQRVTESYEYSDILTKAASCSDPCEQMAYVAAFTISIYASTSNRTGKPFNPLLGETFECDRMADLGWRAISEQVSHHPPMAAQYCEGRGWRVFQEVTVTSKFRGKYFQIIPLGTSHLEFDSSGNHYTWRNVTTTVHNIIVGKLWVDQHGDTDIINHKDGIKCHLKYIPYSYFTRDCQRKVKGCVMDKDENVKWIVTGTWDDKVEIAPVTSVEGDSNNPVYRTGPYIVAWQRRQPLPESEKYYNFTELASQLNEEEDGVAPTDSRLRPDQRLMESQRWDEANTEKVRLEEKQRAVRRKREAEAEAASAAGQSYPPYEPIWFKKEKEPWTGQICHIYNGNYWVCKEKQQWDVCPDIFGTP
ncbi:oxysterol-binding protein 1 isoform X2 [Frankliniella occidentalis]|uniref:Oxysterol-binding protein n=1 Tax=Frankliniella occidentalis TaxID=133901 RepID=A0A6J1STG0_FRAOC|nr:oxysterol-binding protein 1 isoform X2 [Frankliniella occidentalis]